MQIKVNLTRRVPVFLSRLQVLGNLSEPISYILEELRSRFIHTVLKRGLPVQCPGICNSSIFR